MYKFTVKFSIGKKRMQRIVEALDEDGAKEELKKQIKFHCITKKEKCSGDAFVKDFFGQLGIGVNGKGNH